MKKIIVLLLLTALLLVGCGDIARINSETYDVVDTEYDFNYAYVLLPSGTVEGYIKSWRDFSDGDQLQVEFGNGDIYLAHSSVIILKKVKK